MKSFRILTNLNCSKVNAIDSDEARTKLFLEQKQVLATYRFGMGDYVWVTNGSLVTICTIEQAIERILTIKEGADLVMFSDGRIGYVGYNGTNTSYFEIIQTSSYDEKMDMLMGAIAMQA